jgi:hypothetical protein
LQRKRVAKAVAPAVVRSEAPAGKRTFGISRAPKTCRGFWSITSAGSATE